MESFFQFNKAGVPLDSIYSSISTSPIAAASLGQVYKDKFKYSEQHVAVKVIRKKSLSRVELCIGVCKEGHRRLKAIRGATDLPATLSASSIGQLDQATNFSLKSLEISTSPTEEEINTTEKEIAEAQPLKKSTKRALFQHTTNIEGDSIIKKPKHKG
ncbi:ABC1-like kinase [Tanacetum coccineum]